MKTFKDFKFELYADGVVGKINIGVYEISVAMNQLSHGGLMGLWEICVFKNNDWKSTVMKCFEGNNFCGYLTFEELEKKMIEIQNEISEK